MDIRKDIALYELMPKINITMTSAEVKRLICNRLLTIDGEVITDVTYKVSEERLEKGFTVAFGKKEYRIDGQNV